MVSGFSRKSNAPSLVALTAVSMVPWPEMMTTCGRSVERDLLNARQRFHAVHAGQPDVEQNRVVILAGQLFQALFAGFDRWQSVAFVFEHAAQRFADAGFVVHNQDARVFHARASA